jgi:hypothetical protein
MRLNELLARIEALALTLRAARGEPLEEPGGLDRRIQLLREQLAIYEVPVRDSLVSW